MTDDVCGYCGNGGADKIPAPHGWPGQYSPDTEYVHADCEDAAARDAMEALTDDERRVFLASFR